MRGQLANRPKSVCRRGGLLWLGVIVVVALMVGCAEPETIYVYVPVPSGSDADVSAGDVGSSTLDADADAAEADVAGASDTSADTASQADGTGISCNPDGWYCLDAVTSARCNSTGDGHAEYWDCPPGQQLCSVFTGRCNDVICGPGDKKCASDNAWTLCGPDGTGYLPPTLCGDGQVCNGSGTCVLASCVGRVLFLVDVSSSMGSHWTALKSSIASLDGNNPFAQFGLWTFPKSDTVCEVTTAPAVPIAEGSMGPILSWFDANLPYGQTPLVEAYRAIVSQAGTLFGAEGGSVVVLSDGGDTCAYPAVLDPVQLAQLKVADLGQAATELYVNHNVATYVIGYAYTGDPAQLNAIAANGGTANSTYTAAGSEQELANALIDVLDDIKVCLGP